MVFEANWGVPNVHFGYLGTPKNTCQVSGGSGAGEEFSQEFVETHRKVAFSNAPTTKILGENLDYKVGFYQGYE